MISLKSECNETLRREGAALDQVVQRSFAIPFDEPDVPKSSPHGRELFRMLRTRIVLWRRVLRGSEGDFFEE